MSLLNLKEILASDSISEKLDKINYNFDILVNTAGPVGSIGESGSGGSDGTKGNIGPIGSDGPIGPDGPSGNAGTSEWIATQYTNGSNSTFAIGPKYNANNPNEKTSTVSIGHPDINSGLYSAVSDTSQLTIYNNSEYSSNIRLVSQNTSDFFDIDFSTPGGLTLGFNLTDNTLNLEASELWFSDLSGYQVIEADDSSITFNQDTLFNNSSVEITGSLKLSGGLPSLDKIACSDALGTVVWKSLSEIVNAIPVGMIVPILPSILTDSSNFVQTHSFVVSGSNATPMYTGRGESGSPYDGWYICNGKTWSNGIDSFDTPDLNSFEYNIDVNSVFPNAPNSGQNNQQFNTILDNVNTGIVSSSSVTSNTTINGTSFDFDMTQVSDDVESSLGDVSTLGHTTVSLIRVPHIVYLGVSDLTWNDSGMRVIYFNASPCDPYAMTVGHKVHCWIDDTAFRTAVTNGIINEDGFFISYVHNNITEILNYFDVSTGARRMFNDSTAQTSKNDIIYKENSQDSYTIVSGQWTATTSGASCP